jgi:hypothetical protein
MNATGKPDETMWLEMSPKEKAILHELIQERKLPTSASMDGLIRIAMIDGILSDRWYYGT